MKYLQVDKLCAEVQFTGRWRSGSLILCPKSRPEKWALASVTKTVFSIFLVASLHLSLAGCNEGAQLDPSFPSLPGLGTQDLKIAKTGGNGSYRGYGPGGNYGLRSGGTIYPGSAPTAELSGTRTAQAFIDDAGEASTDVGPKGSYQLNFENANIATVCKVIFVDLLHTNYEIDPRVVGQINLTSSVPIPRNRLIPLLESALLSANASVIKDNGFYRIAPTVDPGGLQRIDYQSAGEGYGVTVIGTKNVAAGTVAHLLEQYGSRAGSVRFDQPASLVIVRGTAVERQAALEMANMIDVDWLRSRTVAILPLANASPDSVIKEVNNILGSGEGELSQGVVQMQPITRLNAILAVSRNRGAVSKIATWVRRLDRQDIGAIGVKSYRLEYAQAKTVAAVLNAMFSNGSQATLGQSAKDQLEAGHGASLVVGTANGPSSMSTGNGRGSSAGTGSALAGSAGNGNSFGPFGALKTSMTIGGPHKSTDDAAPNGMEIQGGFGNSRIRIVPDVVSNTLLIYSNRQDYKLVERAIRELDRAPTQVNIEVTIAEVQLTRQLQYGVQAYLNNGNVAVQLSNATQAPGIPLMTANPALNLLVGAIANPRVVISALQNITHVKILSSPSLVVADRQRATLQVGDQVPVLTQQVTSTVTSTPAVVNSVDYKDTGIILNVLPRVNANNVVSLDIEQQISNVVNTDTKTLTPTISERRVASTVSVPSGQTVLLAGLIEEKHTASRSGIPGIVEFKFLNDFLANHSSEATRDELIIFIRPQIIHNAFDAAQVSEEFRTRLLSMQPNGIAQPKRP